MSMKKEMVVVGLIVAVVAASVICGGLYALELGIAHGKSQEASKYLQVISDLQSQIASAGKLNVVRDSIYPVTVVKQVDSKAGFNTVEVQFGPVRIMAVMENGAKIVPGSKAYMINVWFKQFDGTASVIPLVLTHEP